MRRQRLELRLEPLQSLQPLRGQEEAAGETRRQLLRTALPAAALIGLAAAASRGWLLGPALCLGTLAWLWALRGASRASGAQVLLVAALIRLPFLGSDLHSTDLYRYVWEGRIQLAGVSPYASTPDDALLAPLRRAEHGRILHPDLPTLYPPLAQGLFAGSAALGLRELGLRNLILAIDGLVVVLLVAWLASCGRPPGHALAYAWCPVVVASAAAGHVDPLMLVFLVVFAWAWERRAFDWAAAGLAAAILSKTVAALLLPWVLLRRPRLAAPIAAVVALGYLPFLAQGNLLGSLGTFADEFAWNGPLHAALRGLAGPALPAGLGGLWIAGLSFSGIGVASAGAYALAGLLALAPTVHSWYLSWLAVFVPRLLGSPAAWPLVAWLAAAVLMIPAYAALILGRPAPSELWQWAGFAIPGAVALGVAWRLRPRRPRVSTRGARPPGSVAVIVPCRGEVESLRELLPAWEAAGVERVVVADWPSGDGTRALCAEQPRVRYLPVGPGYGAAVSAGLAATADVDYAVVCDADHAEGPTQLGALLAPLADPGCALVTAARSDPHRLTLLQRAGNALVTALIGLGWGRWLRDLGPYRALRVAAWRDVPLLDRRFGWNVEMNVRALQRGLGVVEVSLPSGGRRHGRNRITGSWRSSLAAGWGMLRRLLLLRADAPSA